jgi:SAM-dependent methyltransferase
MKIRKFYNLAEFETYLHSAEFSAHREFEQNLVPTQQTTFKFSAICKVCNKYSLFLVDQQFGAEINATNWQPNWRERLVCSCNLNNRQRAILHIIQKVIQVTDGNLSLYTTEQITPVYQWLKQNLSAQIVGSEYLGAEYEPGSLHSGITDEMIRHEDLEQLSFNDNSFDIVLSNDVLEHVNKPEQAMSEIYRVLKPQGQAFISIPFHVMAALTQKRAEIINGELIHYLPAMYHGNPLSEQGSLVFNDFGWDVLVKLQAVGFTQVCLCHYWSPPYAYLGEPQYYIWAYKQA